MHLITSRDIRRYGGLDGPCPRRGHRGSLTLTRRVLAHAPQYPNPHRVMKRHHTHPHRPHACRMP
eukprot:scaffold5458_cov131-Isochrysis_galbana.AAC.10